MGRKLMKGDRVTIAFDPHDSCVVEDMKRYNGVSTTISKIHTIKTRLGSTFGNQYELKGIVSTVGKIPYTFTRDMFIDNEVEVY